MRFGRSVNKSNIVAVFMLQRRRPQTVTLNLFSRRVKGNAVELTERRHAVVVPPDVPVLQGDVIRTRGLPAIVSLPPRMEASPLHHELGDAANRLGDLPGLVRCELAVTTTSGGRPGNGRSRPLSHWRPSPRTNPGAAGQRSMVVENAV